MRVKTHQALSFVDDMIAIPSSELDVLNRLIDWSSLKQHLADIKGDYCPVSLFKLLLLQTWHNLSATGIAAAVHRDLVFMHFCGFSLSRMHRPSVDFVNG